jgi:hypothetical protein
LPGGAPPPQREDISAVTDHAFDELSKRLSAAATRRGVLKGALAAAVGGVATRLRGAGAAAQTRQACERLGQTCDATHPCCQHLACAAGSCCRPVNETCYADSDCCADNVCRPNPHGMGLRCLPPGDVGAACVEQADCAGSLTCDVYTGTCLIATGDPCAENSDCVSGVCDSFTGLCADDCLPDGAPCVESADCCAAYCNAGTSTCGGPRPSTPN